LLLAADAPFAAALEAVPAEDWCRTWAAGRTIMLRRTSKRVKEVVDKIRLPAVVRLVRSFWDDVVKKVRPNYDSLTVATLKAILRNRNLLVTGNKDDLVARLYIYDAGSKGPGARKAAEKTHFVMKQLTLMTAWCRISTLELPRCDMKGQDADSLAGVLAQCPALAHLDLSENYNFGAAGAERLAGVLAQCRELVRLNLSRNKIGAGGAERLAGVLGNCPALAHLNLRSNSIGPDGAKSLAGVLAQCAALAHLNLSCNAIGSAGAESLAGVLPQCTALAHLNLWYNEIEAAGAEKLAGVLTQCPALAHLNLDGNGMGDDGAESLAGVLGQCAALAHLNLSGNDIGTVGRGRLRASWRGQASGLRL
jgi:Ran GTPase-activating protein (RanGAP) involved in mRNA processing and transport